MSWEDSWVKTAAEKELKKENLTCEEEEKGNNGPEGVTVETSKDAKQNVRKARIASGEGVLSTE